MQEKHKLEVDFWLQVLVTPPLCSLLGSQATRSVRELPIQI